MEQNGATSGNCMVSIGKRKVVNCVSGNPCICRIALTPMQGAWVVVREEWKCTSGKADWGPQQRRWIARPTWKSKRTNCGRDQLKTVAPHEKRVRLRSRSALIFWRGRLRTVVPQTHTHTHSLSLSLSLSHTHTHTKASPTQSRSALILMARLVEDHSTTKKKARPTHSRSAPIRIARPAEDRCAVEKWDKLIVEAH